MTIELVACSREKPICGRFLVAMLIFLFAVSAIAQPDNELTLRQAVDKTIEKNPQLRAFSFYLRADEARVQQVDTAPRPELSLTVEDVLGSGEFTGTNSAQTTLSISWAFEGSLRDKRVDFARSSRAVTEQEQNIQLADSVAQTAIYYLRALALQERIAVAVRSVAVMTQTLEALRKRVDVGRASNAELLSAEADLARLQLAFDDFNQQLAVAYQQLAAQWSDAQPLFSRVNGVLTDYPALIDLATLQQQISNNPRLEKFISLEKVMEAELRLVQQQRKREGWRFSTGVRRLEVNGDYGFVGGFSLPIGGGNFYRGRASEILAKSAAYSIQSDALRLRLETHLFQLCRELQFAVNQGNTLKDTIIPKLEQAQLEIRLGYERGRHSYLELLVVQNKLVDAQFDLLESSLDVHLNVIEIERLTGGQSIAEN